jgi:hypothetical protein
MREIQSFDKIWLRTMSPNPWSQGRCITPVGAHQNSALICGGRQDFNILLMENGVLIYAHDIKKNKSPNQRKLRG